MVHERRQYVRVPLVVDVSYWVNTQERGDSYTVKALDVSEEGIFLKTDTPLGIGSEVRLRFHLPGGGEMISVKGTVVWSDAGLQDGGKGVAGKGIRFFDYDGECRMRLHEFIQEQAAEGFHE